MQKPSLAPIVLNKYQLVSSISFLGKVLDFVVAFRLQGFLDETAYLDPFQSGFMPGYGMKIALVVLVEDLH